ARPVAVARPPAHAGHVRGRRGRHQVLRARDPRRRRDAALDRSRRARRRARPRPGSAARRRGRAAGGTMSWNRVPGYEDILYDKADGMAKITINRPEVRNAFRPRTVDEMSRAFADARYDPDVGVVILTGAGDQAFCSGGDQRVRGDGGYVGSDGVPRLNVLDLQRQIRTLPKPVIAMVAGYAIGGGHVLHLMCDLTIAADNAIF